MKSSGPVAAGDYEATAPVQQIYTGKDGQLTLLASEGAMAPDGVLLGSMQYTLSPDLALVQASLTSGFRIEHLRLERAGLLDHAARRHEGEVPALRRWSVGGWRDLARLAQSH